MRAWSIWPTRLARRAKLLRCATCRSASCSAYRTVQENLFVGVGVVHVLGIVAALLGWIGPIQAAILHLGPDVLVFVN